MAAAAVMALASAGRRTPKNARTEVPASAAKLFSTEGSISLRDAAKLLGFEGPAELKKHVAAALKRFADAEPLEESVGAHVLNRLVILCAAKTGQARDLLGELSSCWTAADGGKRTVSMPSYPYPKSGALWTWPECDPDAVGMAKAPFDRVRQHLEWRTRQRHFAGVACGVVHRGRLAFYCDAGFADAEAKTRMSGDTLMRLFSMTKCLVAAAFMSYQEDPSKGIDLDDAVAKYIPAFANAKVMPKRGQKEPQPADKPMTLRQLLTHTSGLGYGPTLGDAWPPTKDSYYRIYQDLCEGAASGRIASLEQWCDELAKVPLKGQPGRYWDYSFSLDVLGRVLEIISGKPLDVVVEERICGPLGMRDTGFSVPAEQASRLGPWYQSAEVPGKPKEAHTLEIVDPAGSGSGWMASRASKILSGGGTVEVPLAMKGGMVSTFNDYLRFLLMLRNQGELDGVRVLKRETVQLMILNHVPASCYGKKTIFVFNKPGAGYGLLGQIQSQHPKMDKGCCPGEYGWGGLAGPAWTIDPRADLIILSMTQTAFVLDHEEYVRYAARRAIHQYAYGLTAAPSRATSYPPETADAIGKGEGVGEAKERRVKAEPKERKVKAEPKEAAKGPRAPAPEVAVLKGQENQEVTVKRRVWRAWYGASGHEWTTTGGRDVTAKVKELLKSRDTFKVSNENFGDPAPGKGKHLVVEVEAEQRPVARPEPPAAMFTDADLEAEHTNHGFSRQPSAVEKAFAPGRGLRVDGEPSEEEPSPSKKRRVEKDAAKEKDETMLFSRVRVPAPVPGDDTVKARVTAVRGDTLEVVTEGGWSTMDVHVGSVLEIDESHIATSNRARKDDPVDFGFLMNSAAAPAPTRP